MLCTFYFKPYQPKVSEAEFCFWGCLARFPISLVGNSSHSLIFIFHFSLSNFCSLQEEPNKLNHRTSPLVHWNNLLRGPVHIQKPEHDHSLVQVALQNWPAPSTSPVTRSRLLELLVARKMSRQWMYEERHRVIYWRMRCETKGPGAPD